VKWLRILLGLVAVVVVGTIADWQHQGWLVRHAVSTLHGRYTVGMRLELALADIQLKYPEHTQYSPDDCTKFATSVPTYRPLGGPCIFGIMRTGATWWGFESAVMFKLLFDPNGELRNVVTDPVYTFL
jgi:hypothetical protein